MKVALIQFNIQWENVSYNLNYLDALMELEDNARLIVLPEMFSTGFTMNVAKIAQSSDGLITQWMKDWSIKKQCAVMGSIAILENQKYFNRLFIFDKGILISYYDKKHLFKLGDEHKHYSPGNKENYVKLDACIIKTLICYDLRFPIWCFNKEKADIMVFCANWPSVRQHHWEALLVARAIENQCFVIGVNRIGVDANQIHHPGKSKVIRPDGTYLLDCEAKEGIFYAEMDVAEVQKFRITISSLQEGINQDF